MEDKFKNYEKKNPEMTTYRAVFGCLIIKQTRTIEKQFPSLDLQRYNLNH